MAPAPAGRHLGTLVGEAHAAMDERYRTTWAGLLHSCPDDVLGGDLVEPCASPAPAARACAPAGGAPSLGDGREPLAGLRGVRSASLPPTCRASAIRGRRSLSGRLSPVGLAAACREMRVQVVAERVHMMCGPCAAHVRRVSAGSTASLTHLLRALCGTCRLLFFPGGRGAPGGLPTPSSTPGPVVSTPAGRVVSRVILRAPPTKVGGVPGNESGGGHPVGGGNAGAGMSESSQTHTAKAKDDRRREERRKRDERRREARRKDERRRVAGRLALDDLPVYALLLDAGADWCRLCGHVGDASSTWQPGPWGARSFCAGHVLPAELLACGRLPERLRPIIQDYCAYCRLPCVPAGGAGEMPASEAVAAVFRPHCFARCFGCPRTFHTACLRRAFPGLSSGRAARLAHRRWFCAEACRGAHARALAMACPADTDSDESEDEHAASPGTDGARALSMSGDALPDLAGAKRDVQKRKAKPVPAPGGSPAEPRPQRRYAKVLASPPTPPSSPGSAAARKKKAAASHATPDEEAAERVLVCFDSSGASSARNTALAREKAFAVDTPYFAETPEYPPVARGPPADADEAAAVASEDVLLRRHERYEEVEKHMRLCRPQVLRSLHAGEASLPDDVFETDAAPAFVRPPTALPALSRMARTSAGRP